jgi:hypothetical protein
LDGTGAPQSPIDKQSSSASAEKVNFKSGCLIIRRLFERHDALPYFEIVRFITVQSHRPEDGAVCPMVHARYLECLIRNCSSFGQEGFANSFYRAAGGSMIWPLTNIVLTRVRSSDPAAPVLRFSVLGKSANIGSGEDNDLR